MCMLVISLNKICHFVIFTAYHRRTIYLKLPEFQIVGFLDCLLILIVVIKYDIWLPFLHLLRRSPPEVYRLHKGFGKGQD